MSPGRAIPSYPRTRNGRDNCGARRGWIARLLPIALLALIIQVLAPVAASTIAAAAASTLDPFDGAAICHAEVDAAPSNRETDRTACGLDCVMCCVLHAAVALDLPPVAANTAPLRGWARIAWIGRELTLIHLPSRSQTQPRGPPVLS